MDLTFSLNALHYINSNLNLSLYLVVDNDSITLCGLPKDKVFTTLHGLEKFLTKVRMALIDFN